MLNGTMDGLDDMLRRIRQLEEKVARKLIKQAVDQGGTVLLNALKPLIPPFAPRLRKALGKKTKQPKVGFAWSVIGARKQFAKDRKTGAKKLSTTGKRIASDGGKGKYPTRYFHLIDKGTKPRKTKSGKSTGRMRAWPAMTPAVIRSRTAVRGKMADVLRAGLRG